MPYGRSRGSCKFDLRSFVVISANVARRHSHRFACVRAVCAFVYSLHSISFQWPLPLQRKAVKRRSGVCSLVCLFRRACIESDSPMGSTDAASVCLVPAVRCTCCCLRGRGTLGILLFIAGRGRKAYWTRGGAGRVERRSQYNSWMHAIG